MTKPIVVHMKWVRSAEKEQFLWTKGLETLIEKIIATKDAGMELLIETETIEKKWSQEEKNSPGANPSTMARVVKPEKVSSWPRT